MKLIFVKHLAPGWIAWTRGVPFRGEGHTKAEAVGDLFFWMQDLDIAPLIEIVEVYDRTPGLLAAGGEGGAL